MSGKYAQNTKVATDRSKADIERLIARYGATGFAYGWQNDMAVISFTMEGRHIQFRLEMPSFEEFALTETGRQRKPNIQHKEWEKAQRQSWRSLKLIIHAKLESVETGVYTFDQAFLSDIVLPDGKRVADHAIPQIEQSYAAGRVVMGLLPATVKD